MKAALQALVAVTVLVFPAAPVSGDEIHEAAEGDLERVKKLLETNSGLIHATDDYRRTPLHLAARFADREIVA